MIFALAAWLTTVAGADAQFGVPFGGPGLITSPEAVSGAIGASAAHGAAQQQNCIASTNGRDGPRGLCVNGQPTPPPRR